MAVHLETARVCLMVDSSAGEMVVVLVLLTVDLMVVWMVLKKAVHLALNEAPQDSWS
jgi:hypothetical protein